MIAIKWGIARLPKMAGSSNGSISLSVHTARPPLVNPTPSTAKIVIKIPIWVKDLIYIYPRWHQSILWKFWAHEHDILPIVACRKLAIPFKMKEYITVNEKAIENMTHESMPPLIAWRKQTRPKNTHTASQPKYGFPWFKDKIPWSKSYPSGDDVPVRLACFPSTASNV